MRYARFVRAAATAVALATISSSAVQAASRRVCTTFADTSDAGAMAPTPSLDIQRVGFGAAEDHLRIEVTVADAAPPIGPVGDSVIVGFSVDGPGGPHVRIGHDNAVWFHAHGFAYVNGRYAAGSKDAVDREVDDDTVVLSVRLPWLREVLGPHIDDASLRNLWVRTYRTVEGKGGALGPDDFAEAPAETVFNVRSCS